MLERLLVSWLVFPALAACAAPDASPAASGQDAIVGGSSCSLSLEGQPAGSLDAARTAFDAACKTGGNGTWCGLGDLRAFDLPACTPDTTSLDDIAEAASESVRPAADYVGARTLTRAELEASPLFAANGGPALLAALDARAGSKADVTAQVSETEIACHNCTTYAVRFVVLYRDARVVFVVEGTRGYDS